MRNWQNILPVSLLGFSLMLGALIPVMAQAQDTEGDDYSTPAVSTPSTCRKMLHLFSSDFPPNPLGQYPTPPVQETRFWQLLDKEMAATTDLTLTDNLEDADYRIELRCGGIFHCSKLLVDVKNPDRIVLTSFKLEKFAPFRGLGNPRLEQVARDLSRTLQKRIELLDKGGFGHTD
jgi:hypothetical protein